MRKISLKSLNGRLIIISNSPDKCLESDEADRLADVIGYGQLNVFRPVVAEKANGSQEFFLREINTVNKQKFEKKNENKNKNKISDDLIGEGNSKDEGGLKKNESENEKKKKSDYDLSWDKSAAGGEKEKDKKNNGFDNEVGKEDYKLDGAKTSKHKHYF